MKIPAYYGFWHHLGNWLLKVSSWLVLLFLILPILVIVPLSFNAEPFFSFTEDMLTLDPEAYSLRWYREILDDPKWILAIKNSFFIGILSTILATILGTCAAVGLARDEMPFRRFITALLLSPMIVPLIITAVVMMLLIYLGMILLLIPGIYLGVAYLLAVPLVVERGLSPWQALEASRKAITQHWFKVFGLFIVLGLIVIVSAIPLGIGLVWTIPLMVVAMGVLYRTIFGVLPAAR